MSDTDYGKALKSALKEVHSCNAHGLDPSLPVLDDILLDKETAGTEELGIIQIPAEFIIGTVSSGRANLFARNFMPLAQEGSEFAYKWESLCRSHLEEGIHDPVRAYEYMNRYYVLEGNKRVSVLKYFDAVSIDARVRSLLPAKDGSPETELYYELRDFIRLTHVRYLECTQKGSYLKLLELLGKDMQHEWNETEQRMFRRDFYNFRNVYEELGGTRLDITAGDALLSFLEIYGYDALRGRTDTEIKASLAHVWEEVFLKQDPRPIQVRLRPEKEKKPGIIDKVISVREPAVLKAAFIHDASPESSSWTNSHEKGRLYVTQAMSGQVETCAYYDAMFGDPYDVIRRAAEDGAKVLFTTSPRMMPASLRAAVAYPDITVFNCSLNQPHRYIRTYYPRMYEVKFVIGAIAGALAAGEPVGYLCDYPIFGQIAGINAFALGVQMVNPNTEVYLEWTTVGGPDEARKRLKQHPLSIISSIDQIRSSDYIHHPGLVRTEGDNDILLAMPQWLWGTYYEEILKRLKNRMIQSEYRGSTKALNYYWGLSAGVVGLEVTDQVPASVRKLADLLLESIKNGTLDPFRGPLRTAQGTVLENNEALAPEDIISMDYLLDNVRGTIPKYNELSDLGKATVDRVGVRPAMKNAEADHHEDPDGR